MRSTILLTSHPYPSQAAFMDAFQFGAHDAFIFIHKAMHPDLTNYLEKFFLNPLEIEDIISAIFLKIYLHRQKITGLQHIRRWLYRCAHNTAINVLRQQKKETSTLCDLRYLTPNADAHIDEVRDRQNLFKKLHTSIDRLPPQRKKIICLYYFGHKTTHEIAQDLQLSPQTILNHKTLALSDLRKTLAL